MLILVKKRDKTYGGYDYLEVDTENKVYSTGCTRGHAGHGFRHKAGYEHMEIPVNTNRALNDQIETIANQGYNKVDSMYKYHRDLTTD